MYLPQIQLGFSILRQKKLFFPYSIYLKKSLSIMEGQGHSLEKKTTPNARDKSTGSGRNGGAPSKGFVNPTLITELSTFFQPAPQETSSVNC